MLQCVIHLFSQQLTTITPNYKFPSLSGGERYGETRGFKKSARCYAVCLQDVHIPLLILEHYKLLKHICKAGLYVCSSGEQTSGDKISSAGVASGLFYFYKMIFFNCRFGIFKMGLCKEWS